MCKKNKCYDTVFRTNNTSYFPCLCGSHSHFLVVLVIVPMKFIFYTFMNITVGHC